MVVNTYIVLVQKDTFATVPTVVAEYEIPILQELHGENHIFSAEGKLISEGVGNPVGSFESPEDEYSRLCRKYGGAVVASTIGKPADLKKAMGITSRRKAKPQETTAE